ncbi:hypothetical protein ABBQ32_009598 [Trebouxia sp. C0010 RCD-2024]
MPPKRQKEAKAATPSKRARTGKSEFDNSSNALVDSLISDKLLGQTYCEELGIDLSKGSNAVFQWLACSSMFGSRLSETITMRAARGLLESKLSTPQAISEAPLEEEVEALHSEGNVQRAPSMSHYLNQTSKAVLDKYKGDLDNLREQAKHDPAKERQLIKEFKGFGDVAVNIFCREAQEVWEELFPFADDRSLKLAAEHGLPHQAAKLAVLVDNDRHKFVRLLAALIRSNLRKVPVNDEEGTVDSGGVSLALLPLCCVCMRPFLVSITGLSTVNFDLSTCTLAVKLQLLSAGT